MSPDSTDTVQLLVEDDANRDALEGLLEEQFTVATETAELVGDLYLVDDRSFSAYRDRLEARNDHEEPSFTPVLLVCREETTVDESLLRAPVDGRPLVDDIVDAPVRQHVLVRRLSNLLAHRRQFERLAAQNERLEEFAGVVSHDLRNPLQVAKGRAELLASSVSDAEREHLEEIEESLHRMDEIVDNVLTLAREGTVADDVTEITVSAVVQAAWSVIDAPNATLVEPDPTATILAEQELLLTVFENLFRNAVEHGSTSPDSKTRQNALAHGPTSYAGPTESEDAVEHAGETTIEVGITDDGFYVADDGPGIPPDERDDVLERGYTTADDGMGLGLDIVTNVVEAHGWEITVGESESGGARFDITGVSRPQ